MRRRRWRQVKKLHFATGDAAHGLIESIDRRAAETPEGDTNAVSLLPPLPRAVETFGLRFLAISFEACAPPVSNSLRVKIRGAPGIVGIEVVAKARDAYQRMVVAPLTGVLLADLTRWAWAFSSSYRIERNRRGQLRIRVSVVVDPDELATGHLWWSRGWGWTRDQVPLSQGRVGA
jgi:hypothetical protein